MARGVEWADSEPLVPFWSTWEQGEHGAVSGHPHFHLTLDQGQRPGSFQRREGTCRGRQSRGKKKRTAGGGSDDQAKLQHKPGTFYTILPATYRKCPALHLQVSERALHLP